MARKKLPKEETEEIQVSTETKPLGHPVPNKFLLMLVKNYIKNGD